MLKALLKKQFLELNALYYTNRKTGKRRSKGGAIAFAILMIVIFLIVAVSFFGMGIFLAGGLIEIGLDWVYFAIMSIIALALGVFGSIFNTYSSLYKAKDNDLLLAMPIPPAMILFVRMVGVYIMSLFFCALVWVPAAIAFLIMKGVYSIPEVLLPLILTIFIALLVTVITCALGFVIALFAGKTRNKSAVTIIISVVFFLFYFLICSRMSQFLQEMVNSGAAIGDALTKWAYPIYLLGSGAANDIGGFLLFIIIAVVLFAICYLILSKTFIRLVTRKTGEKKIRYVEKEVKVATIDKALLRRELKHLFSSPTYLLNAGMGLILIPIIAVLALVKMDSIRDTLDAAQIAYPFIAHATPCIVTGIVCFGVSTCVFTAPSVSLEGKTLWIVRTLPVSAWDVLRTKERMHILLATIPTLFTAIVLGIVVKADFSEIIWIALISWMFMNLIADLGLMVNLKHPNLTWTNEAVPIKQSMATFVSLVGGMGISLGIMLLGVVMGACMDSSFAGLVVLLVLFVLLNRMIKKWLKTKGVQLFENL